MAYPAGALIKEIHTHKPGCKHTKKGKIKIKQEIFFNELKINTDEDVLELYHGCHGLVSATTPVSANPVPIFNVMILAYVLNHIKLVYAYLMSILRCQYRVRMCQNRHCKSRLGFLSVDQGIVLCWLVRLNCI